MYVNTVGLTNKNIHEYLQTLTDRTTLSNKYPVTSQIKIDNFKLGGESMSALLMERMKVERKMGRKEGREEGREEGRLSTFIDLVKQNILDAKRAATMLGMPVAEFNALLNRE